MSLLLRSSLDWPKEYVLVYLQMIKLSRYMSVGPKQLHIAKGFQYGTTVLRTILT